jgi:hypothetical protein
MTCLQIIMISVAFFTAGLITGRMIRHRHEEHPKP